MKLAGSLTFLLFAATAPSLAAPPPADFIYTAGRIVFNHPGPYSQAQLEAAAEIHTGTKFKMDDLGNAAQRLIDTGYFANVGATVSGDVTKINVLFDIQPFDNSQMIHIGYENFVWLTRAEIEDALRAKSPLFLGYLPENSPLIDTFNDALTAALAAKGISAEVGHDTIEPTLRSPARILDFRVVQPSVRVANVQLAGVSPDLVPLVQTSVNSVAGTLYAESPAGATTADHILAPLLDAGYVQASLSGITITPSVSGDKASVVLAATLTPGDIYRVSSITFAGTSVLSADAFAASAKLHAGDIASRALLFDTLAPLDAAYRRQGYMDVIAEALPDANPATHQVAYTVSVKPGEQYRIHNLTTNGLDPAAQAEFDRGFRMKVGELYDPDYLTGFLKNNTALQSLVSYSFAYKAYADPNNHTVNLVLTFFHGSGTATRR